MDMKRILQALDGASTKPVEGANDMSKFLKIVASNDVKVLKEDTDKILSEGANPHKVSLPVQMAMQHYQQPTQPKLERKPSLLEKYFNEVNQELVEEQNNRKELLRQYSQQIAERVMLKKTEETFEIKKIKPKRKTSPCRTGQVQTGMQTQDGKQVPKCSVKFKDKK